MERGNCASQGFVGFVRIVYKFVRKVRLYESRRSVRTIRGGWPEPSVQFQGTRRGLGAGRSGESSDEAPPHSPQRPAPTPRWVPETAKNGTGELPGVVYCVPVFGLLFLLLRNENANYPIRNSGRNGVDSTSFRHKLYRIYIVSLSFQPPISHYDLTTGKRLTFAQTNISDYNTVQ